MSVRLKRETIEAGSLLRAQPQQIIVEAEATLPGGLRDDVLLFHTEAKALPIAAETAGGRVTVSGQVAFRALYAQGDLTRVRSIEETRDFSRPLNADTRETQARYEPVCEITAVSARVFNGRLLMRAEMNVGAEANETHDVQVVTALEEENAQVLSDTLTVRHTVGEGSGQGLVKGEFEISQALQADEALLGSGEARVEDILGGADGRAAVTGTIDLTVCHASRMPGHPLVYTQHSLPFEQQVTLSGEPGEMLSASVRVTDVAAALEEGENGQTLRAEVGVDARVQALRDEQCAVISDVFSDAGDLLTPSGERMSFCVGYVNDQTAESGRVQIVLPEDKPRIQTVLAAFVQPVLAGARSQGGKLHADMLLRSTLIYMTEDSGIPVSYTAEEPMRMAFAGELQEDDALSLSASRVEAAAVAGDRAEIRFVLTLQGQGARYRQVFAVTDAVTEEAPPSAPALALYRTQGDERLWDVMKRYRLSAESLKAFNEQLRDKEADQTLPQGLEIIAYRR
ncbi:MAG: hypothetical protein IJ157_09555 [Clostridia bacterium]|nr:hypothetical protein [Clostridia bacterium]